MFVILLYFRGAVMNYTLGFRNISGQMAAKATDSLDGKPVVTLVGLFHQEPSQLASKEVVSFTASTGIDADLAEADRKLSLGLSLFATEQRSDLVVERCE